MIGTVGFDANGDSTQQMVSFFRVDPQAADGKGDWTLSTTGLRPAPIAVTDWSAHVEREVARTRTEKRDSLASQIPTTGSGS